MGTPAQTPLQTELAAIQKNLDDTKTALTGIAAGVAALDALIQQLKASAPPLSAADQATLDAISTASTALASQAQAVNTAPPA